jgi:hypothetical protein
MESQLFVKICVIHGKKRLSKFIKKITYVGDMMIHNSVKYLVWKLDFALWLYSRTTFWLEICYFYISQTILGLDKIFNKVVHYHIIYMCDFFKKIRRLFLSCFTRVFMKVLVST